MEAFFVAVALELGTATGPDEYFEEQRKSKRPLSPEEIKWVQAYDISQASTFMRKHPGAPPMLAKIKRMHREAAGGLKHQVNDENFFWNLLAESYVKWCRSSN